MLSQYGTASVLLLARAPNNMDDKLHFGLSVGWNQPEEMSSLSLHSNGQQDPSVLKLNQILLVALITQRGDGTRKARL